ncbi:MAG: biotin/lipoyl-binding protein [Gammaproteobacteria bacterium]|nr:biotin/lipoyl-binding protein [Gammaproteobacteria bacterium]
MTAYHVLARRLWPRSPRGRRMAAGAAMLAGAALTSVSIFATGPASVPEERTEKAWPVSVLTVQPEPLHPSFTAYGRVESNRTARISTDLAATVTAVNVREGDRVSEGDVLVELAREETALLLAERQAELAGHRAQLRSIRSEQAMLERTVAQAQSMHRIAQDKLARHRQLLERRLISRSLLDEVVAQANNAAIEFEQHQRRLDDLPNRLAAQQALVDRSAALAARAELDLQKTRVLAPFSGPILAVHVAPGDRSGNGVALLELAEAGALEVRVQVPASYVERFQHHLSGDDPIAASLADGRRLQLARLTHRVRAGQSGVDAFFRLDDPGAATLPPIGRVVDLRIRLPEEAGVVALPIASLYENDRIYAVEDNRLQAIRVERVGELHTAEGDFRVLVRAAELADGRPVITTQLPKAVSGLLVEPS